jgi:hypothetical protein
MKNGNVIIIGLLIKNVEKSIVANTEYRISVQVQRKTMRNLIQRTRFYDRLRTKLPVFESGKLSRKQNLVWLSMVMYGQFKKTAIPYFKLIPQAEKTHDRIKIICLLVEIPFKQVYCTDTNKMRCRRNNEPVSHSVDS